MSLTSPQVDYGRVYTTAQRSGVMSYDHGRPHTRPVFCATWESLSRILAKDGTWDAREIRAVSVGDAVPAHNMWSYWGEFDV